ncbi:MAG TPA: hypothetical protein VFZ21_09135 [Gemmatimonadaceae bacterium]|jgi:hypothetical protein|nr:hypothetical protein [Gemmatimonadaceae bacterium]
MARRFALNFLAYLVPTFILGFVWHLVLFASYYRDLGIYRPDVIVPLGFLSMVVQGAVFAAIYPRVVAAPDAVASGLAFGAVAAVLSWSFTTLAVAAKHPMASVPRYLIIETAFTVVQFLLVGVFLALSSRGAATVRAPAVRPAA